MKDQTIKERIARAQRRKEAINLHEIEGNPFNAEDEAMFKMFDREGFTDEQRVAYIKAKFTVDTEVNAAE